MQAYKFETETYPNGVVPYGLDTPDAIRQVNIVVPGQAYIHYTDPKNPTVNLDPEAIADAVRDANARNATKIEIAPSSIDQIVQAQKLITHANTKIQGAARAIIAELQ
jgi:hypothetical protein